MRHSWLKLKEHYYICRKCGIGKRNELMPNHEWVPRWLPPSVEKPAGFLSSKTPPCEPGPDTDRRLKLIGTR